MLTGHTLWPFIVYRLGLAVLLVWWLATRVAVVPAV
jgi:hypothetical protein